VPDLQYVYCRETFLEQGGKPAGEGIHVMMLFILSSPNPPPPLRIGISRDASPKIAEVGHGGGVFEGRGIHHHTDQT
jgi:hypothetical protein